jgi:hypothetical protein
VLSSLFQAEFLSKQHERCQQVPQRLWCLMILGYRLCWSELLAEIWTKFLPEGGRAELAHRPINLWRTKNCHWFVF